MKKYIFIGDDGKQEHWDWCISNKKPFIEISPLGPNYSNIFYDITDISDGNQIQEIAEELRNIYEGYLKFTMLSHVSIQGLLDNYYFNSMIIKKEHEYFFSNDLYDFIDSALKI